MQRAKAERLIFAGVALNEDVLFCVSRFGGLSALPRITFLKAMLIAACFAGCIKGLGSLYRQGSVELVRLKKAMRSMGLTGWIGRDAT